MLLELRLKPCSFDAIFWTVWASLGSVFKGKDKCNKEDFPLFLSYDLGIIRVTSQYKRHGVRFTNDFLPAIQIR